MEEVFVIFVLPRDFLICSCSVFGHACLSFLVDFDFCLVMHLVCCYACLWVCSYQDYGFSVASHVDRASPSGTDFSSGHAFLDPLASSHLCPQIVSASSKALAKHHPDATCRPFCNCHSSLTVCDLSPAGSDHVCHRDGEMCLVRHAVRYGASRNYHCGRAVDAQTAMWWATCRFLRHAGYAVPETAHRVVAV
jgi:hypothetical protein